jgi:DNA-binding SARP family transcriptional activator/tetratricopeptide (TPR) repeat protein
MEDTSPQPIFLRSLGNCVIETQIGTITPHQEILFATALFLILNRHRRLTRDAVESILWPDLRNSKHAHHRLRQTILKLKEVGFPIQRDNGFLKIGQKVATDFEDLIANHKEGRPTISAESFDLLPQYTPNISVAYAHWLDERKQEIHSHLVRLLLEHIRLARTRGEWARVESLTRACASIDPYNEEAVLARAEAIALRGGKLEAIALLDDYVAELGSAQASLRLPATLMRSRISERTYDTSYETREIPLLGRESQLEALNLALESTERGNGVCCILEGDVGMGKSRLLSEFAAFAQLKGHEVRFSRSQPSDQSRPLSTLVELIGGLRKLRGAIGCSPESIECLNRLTSNPGQSLHQHQPYHGLPPEYLLAAILDLLDAVSEENTIVLIVDDAQWLGAATFSVFEAIVGWASTHKVMTVIALRDAAAEWPFLRNLRSAQFLCLSPLSNEHSTTLVHALTHQRSRQLTRSELTWFVGVGEGNPFFLKELVARWMDSGKLEETPPSLVAITNHRLRKLSRPALQILQTCAVLGRFSSIARLEHVLEFKTFELLDGLNELGIRGLIRTERLPGQTNLEPPIVCSHELIGTAAVKFLSDPAKIALHRRLGVILERETSIEYSPSLLAEAAHHWESSGDMKHALRLTTSYANHLMGIGVPTEAIHSYKKAVTFCQSNSEMIEVLKALIPALYAAGHWQQVGEAIEQLKETLVADSQSVIGHSETELIGFEAKWRSSNEWHDLLDQVKRCIFDENAPSAHRVRAAVLGLKLATNVEDEEELDQIFAAVESSLDDPHVEPEARLYVEMVYNIDRGQMEKGKCAAMSLVARERCAGNSANLIWALVNAAQAMRRCGELSLAKKYLEEAFSVARGKNLPARACTVAHHLVLTALAEDDIKAAKQWLDAAREYAIPSEDLHTQHEHLYYGARIALMEGKTKEALDLHGKILLPNDQSRLRRISLIALSLRLRVRESSPHEEIRRLVDELDELFKRERARGGQDFEAFSLYLGEVYLADSSAARQGLEEYVASFRRETGPPSPEILLALKS